MARRPPPSSCGRRVFDATRLRHRGRQRLAVSSNGMRRAHVRCTCFTLSAMLVALAHLPGARAQAPAPSRIVSLDLCADQLLIELVDRARIAAVTHLAADSAVSAIPERAKGLPVTHGAAEDVLRYDP